MFDAPNTIYALTIDEYGIFEEHRTFKVFTDSQRPSDGNQYFEMSKGDGIHAKLSFSWKKGFDSGIALPKFRHSLRHDNVYNVITLRMILFLKECIGSLIA